MDEITQLFNRLNAAPSAMGINDPNATAYETQGGQIAPQGFLDDFDQSSADLVSTGLYNGIFAYAPKDSATNLDSTTNILPGWKFYQSSGTGVTAKWISDSAVSGGGKITLTIASGAAGDEGYIEQIIPVQGGASAVVSPSAWFNGVVAGTAGSAKFYVHADYLKSDRSTTTGAQGSAEDTLTAFAGWGLPEPLNAFPNTTGVVPANAAWLRVQIGLKRAAAANGGAGSVDIIDAHIRRGNSGLLVGDSQDPTLNPAFVQQQNGTLTVQPVYQVGATLPAVSLAAFGTNGRVTLLADDVLVNGGISYKMIAPASFSTRRDDYSPEATSGIAAAWMLTNTAGASRSITGISIGQSQGDARLLINVSTGANDITLTHQDANSGASNRFYCPGAATFTLNAGDSAWVIYSGTYWYVVGY